MTVTEPSTSGTAALPGQRETGRRNGSRAPHLTPAERAARGLAARAALPPGEQGELRLAADRPHPVEVMEQQAATRVPELVPMRHGRMMVSPFTFYRGNAKGMAIDLAAAPVSGLSVQMCGDAHLSNFGVFGSPERRLLFDVNDFDETTRGPWEWDVKRLAASMVVAGRANGFTRKECRKIVRATTRRYRDATARFAGMRALDVWYARAEMDEIQQLVEARLDKRRRKNLDKSVAKALSSDSMKAFSKLAEVVDGHARIKADAPVVVPLRDMLDGDRRETFETQIEALLGRYRRTLPSDRRHLLDQFRFVDIARKVVGVGSVGTRCWIVLLEGRDQGDPLFLQVKEAEASVLSEHVPTAMRARYTPRNEGERVVGGQRLMQASSDIFLGWERAEGIDGHQRDFYVRQLRDMKGSGVVESMDPIALGAYGELCGWTLARAHARSGDAIALTSYLGEDDAFPDAVAAFAELYADRNEADYTGFVAAVRDGRLQAETGV